MALKHSIQIICTFLIITSFSAADTLQVYVNPTTGDDTAAGTAAKPLKTLSAAIEHLSAFVGGEIVISLAPGVYTDDRIESLNKGTLELHRSMSRNECVRIVGKTKDFSQSAAAGQVILNWQSSTSDFMIDVTEGNWSLEDVQLGTRQKNQRQGISVSSPAKLELHNVKVHTAGQKAAGIKAHHGGRIYLYGNIELNEDLKNSGGSDDNFCRIEVEYGGLVKYGQTNDATLTLGNGNLSAAYYGIIELGCEKASITSWNYQSNPLAINNSGRIDLHNTELYISAKNPKNTPVGLEHDGHILAEGAHIIIDGNNNSNAIVLQKASTFFCNDVTITGQIRQPLLAMSGSVLLAGINGDLGSTLATTASTIIIEKCTGRLIGPFDKLKGGQIILPDGENQNLQAQTHKLPVLYQAVADGKLSLVKQLIERGCDVNAKAAGGLTPLHLAAIGGHQAVAEMLLNCGADIKTKNDEGLTALQLAEKYNHTQLAEYLKEKESQKK